MNQATQAFHQLTKYALPLAVASFLFSSCSKEPVAGPLANTSSVSQTERQHIQELAGKLPAVGIYNRTMDKILVFKRQPGNSREFSFTTAPANGMNFASSNGGEWVWTADGGMAVITEPSAGLGAGGGTVAAGSTVLDINIAVCFAVGDDAMGEGLFGPDMGEVAGVIGISGDIEALVNGDFSDGESDPFQYFHGFAYYFVYADELSNANYEVLNWVEDLDQPEDELQDFSFAFVISFQNEGGIYLSKDGHISVNGGTMNFNGNYYAVEGVGFFDEEGEGDPEVTVVSGYGAMGCQ
ncbi:MAG TPA: hypothetical protein PLV70_10205 [Flavobacteriales bacterium]|nr:hypothetical protein [Flavobacteriales bacterium]HRN36463.1 hypothetical protein [Flavobacteriales bacterium]HRO40815.1 hypothetical protein [Flavobacteriales bacterium]HRP82765.1 hypothetical protein [Flavobacteriales bacterium]HRQ85473.1 hypothetical protein [Flavobacteriales bacterium]